jgi:hypothetical protein
LWGDRGVLVTLNVATLDKAWRYNRIPKGGGLDRDTRMQYDRAKQWIGEGQKVELWATAVTKEDDEEDALCFVEGRHSFAVLRDLGYTKIEAWVNKRLRRLSGGTVPLENLELSEQMGIILSILILLRCSFFLRHALAGRYTVASRFRCHSCECGSIVRGLRTVCCLAAPTS